MSKTNSRCNIWHGLHKWSKWISRDVPHDVEINKNYHMTYMGSSSETIKYKTVIAVMGRYCDRCDIKESRQASLIKVVEVERVQSK